MQIKPTGGSLIDRNSRLFYHQKRNDMIKDILTRDVPVQVGNEIIPLTIAISTDNRLMLLHDPDHVETMKNYFIEKVGNELVITPIQG